MVCKQITGALWGRGAGCLSGVGTYISGTVGQDAGCLNGVLTSLSGTMGQGCRLFKQSRNLPRGHCWAEAQAA